MGVFKVARGLVVFGVLFAAGCATTPAGPRAEGRLAQLSAEAAVAKLTSGMTGVGVSVRVTGSTRVGAFSWPDGTVELTRGLVERLDEDEIAASLAHELGHVLGGGEAGGVSALSGDWGGHDDVEARADHFATRLLCRAGYPPDAMARALTKVMRSPGVTAACRQRLAKRIALLRQEPTRPN